MKREIVDSDVMESQEEIAQPKSNVKSSRDYIDNERLLEDFKWFRTEYVKFKEGERETEPRMTEYMGEAFIRIADGVSKMPSFRGYTNAWKEEMIDEAIEACLRYTKAFDPARSSNPFSYITFTCRSAFIKKLKEEKREQYKKYKSFIECDGYLAMIDEHDTGNRFNNNGATELTDQYLHAMEFVKEYETNPAYGGKVKKPEAEPEAETKKGLDLLI